MTSEIQSQEKVLVYEENNAACQQVRRALNEELPGANVIAVSSRSEYQREVRQNSFDLVILSRDLTEIAQGAMVQELRLSDQEPGILIVSKANDPESIARLYDAGCDRFIAKERNWIDELVPAMRHLLRLRRLEEENLKIRAKLTEANLLLEEKNRRLDDFSMTIAHDLRGPLGGITMKLDYILESLEGDLPERAKQLLIRALDSSKRITEVIQAMYEFAKLGAKAAKMGAVNLEQLLREVISDLNFDESLDIKIGIGDLPQVWGNAQLLRRVFLNLISNAVKYNDKEEILVNIGMQASVDRGLAKYAEIFIADNGAGIAREDQRGIFDMFTRGISTGRGEGLGLGLSVVQRIVDLHYGQVRVESEPGKGSKFILWLPVEPVEFAS
ncbi:MAG: hypothetical protein DCC75_10930 [Proteobacteria bacterium]|nr:MAG: hypothetical protein DCC75_10930 [Pseudomonadota bacterium]